MTTLLSRRARWTLIVIAIVAASGCASQARTGSMDDVEATRQAVLDREREINLIIDRDLDCDAADARIGDREPAFVSNGLVVRTRAELAQLCEGMLAPRSGAEFAIEHLTANVLSNETAYVVREGDYTIRFKDGSSETAYLVMTTIWNRGPDGWKMVHLHESVRGQG